MPSGVRKRWIAVAQILLVLLAFGFLLAVVVTQWRELQERDVRFEPVWLLPAIPRLVALYVLGAGRGRLRGGGILALTSAEWATFAPP